MDIRTNGCLKYISLFVMCVSFLFWGSSSFYLNAVKVHFNYTQYQVSIIPIMVTSGRLLTPVSAKIYENYGASVTTAIGFTSRGLAMLMLWTSGRYIQFCHDFPAVIYTFFFMMGAGTAFVTVSMLATLTKNFATAGSGKAVSMILTCQTFSSMIMMYIYRRWYTINPLDDATSDYFGFMLFSSLVSSITGCLCIVFVRGYGEDSADTETQTILQYNDKFEDENESISNENSDSQNSLHCCYWPVQFLIWSFALCDSVSFAFAHNFVAIVKTTGNYASFDSCFYTFHIVAICSRIVVGCMLDKQMIPRTLYTSMASLFFFGSFVLFLLKPISTIPLYILSVSEGIVIGVTKSITVEVIVHNFGQDAFARYWGIMSFVKSALVISWILAFSSFYQKAQYETEPESLDCIGSSCLFWTNVLTCIMIGLAAGFNCILLLVKRF